MLFSLESWNVSAGFNWVETATLRVYWMQLLALSRSLSASQGRFPHVTFCVSTCTWSYRHHNPVKEVVWHPVSLFWWCLGFHRDVALWSSKAQSRGALRCFKWELKYDFRGGGSPVCSRLRKGGFSVQAPVETKPGRCSGSARTPEHQWGTLEQDTKPPNTQIGPCNELAYNSGVDLPYTHTEQG